MLKTVMLRILGNYLESTRGLDDKALEATIVKDAKKLTAKDRVLAAIKETDPDVNRRNLKEIILYEILLQEESYGLEESKLDEKVINYEKNLIKAAKDLDFFDPKKHDPIRWHHYDTYRIVLEAAWRNDNVSEDEANLLLALRNYLSISREEHWLIGAYIKRFPRPKCELHTADDINEARKALQREGILWSYRDENNKNIDIIPTEIVAILRKDITSMELQRMNYRRILQHDSITLADLRNVLDSKKMDKGGNKPDVIERIVNGDVLPSQVLEVLGGAKLSEMCRLVGLKGSGSKAETILRLLEFYDDLTFEERTTQDEREEWYNNYELLASRAYADLKAKKIITKDLDIEHQFEKATDFLIDELLGVDIDNSRKISKADGRILLENKEIILWDCKTDEKQVNLQDHIESQFDGYLRKEREKGLVPLAFLVIGPGFTQQSLATAFQYKARTNWDIALVQADALKLLAERWSAIDTEKPFPIKLLNRTEIIDKEKVEILLSLA
ncbi:MAG: hypothetical protein M5U26_27375 [Planctomycetota bacterium]|nr:hypothetical protein [Planctomycetota bacterium]